MTIAIPRLDRTTAAERGLTHRRLPRPHPRRRAPQRPRPAHRCSIVAGALFIYLTAQIAIPREPGPVHRPDVRRPGRRRRARAPGAGSRRSRCTCCSAWSACRSSPRARAGPRSSSGATGGYLVGFVVAGAIVGRLAELGWDRRIGGALAMMLIGSVVIYAIGLPWLRSSRGTDRRGHDRGRPDPVPRLGRGQAGRRGGHLPGRLVARRAAAGRPLGRTRSRRGRRPRRCAAPAPRLRARC